MGFDTKLKLFNHMIVHASKYPDKGDQSNDNLPSTSKELEFDVQLNRQQTRSYANKSKNVKNSKVSND